MKLTKVILIGTSGSEEIKREFYLTGLDQVCSVTLAPLGKLKATMESDLDFYGEGSGQQVTIKIKSAVSKAPKKECEETQHDGRKEAGPVAEQEVEPEKAKKSFKK